MLNVFRTINNLYLIYQYFQVIATVLFVGYSHCLPSIFNTKRECGLSESKSLFDQSISIREGPKKQNLIFMTEFARFMNHKAPELLQVI